MSDKKPKTLIMQPLKQSFSALTEPFIEYYSKQLGANDYCRQRTRLSQVVGIIEFNDEYSAIELLNGRQIAVKQSYDELDQLLFQNTQPRGAVIDLKPFTGGVASKIKEIHFSKSVGGPIPKEEELPVEIRLMGHGGKDQRSSFNNYNFYDHEINRLEPANYNDDHGFIQLKSGKDFYFDIDIATLTRKIIEAKQQGIEIIDLRLETAPKPGLSKGARR